MQGRLVGRLRWVLKWVLSWRLGSGSGWAVGGWRSEGGWRLVVDGWRWEGGWRLVSWLMGCRSVGGWPRCRMGLVNPEAEGRH